MAYDLYFPITLRDEATGATRAAKADEIDFMLTDYGEDWSSETAYPRDKDQYNGVAIFFTSGKVVVHMLFPNWCPGYIPSRTTTQPIRANEKYAGKIIWRADKSYMHDFSFYLHTDGSISDFVIS